MVAASGNAVTNPLTRGAAARTVRPYQVELKVAALVTIGRMGRARSDAQSMQSRHRAVWEDRDTIPLLVRAAGKPPAPY